MKRARQWLPRIAIAASLFALLGTSQPRWTMETPIRDGGSPPAGQAELVTVETTGDADLLTTDRLGVEHVDRCDGALTAGGLRKTVRLLAPGAHFRSARLRGSCATGLLGTTDGPCVPTASTILTARVSPVTVWSRVTTFPAKVHVSRGSIPRPIEIKLADPPEHGEISVVPARPFFGWDGQEFVATHRAGGEYYAVVFGHVGEPAAADLDVDIVVRLTAFGPCPDSAVACVAPTTVPPQLLSARFDEP